MKISRGTGNILIDGPDASGKSTLVKKIHSQLKSHEIIHLTKHTDDVRLGVKYYDGKFNKIFDRGILSNYVYSKVFKDTKAPSWSDVLKVLNKMEHIILCIPGPKDKYLQHFENIKTIRREEYDAMAEVWDGFVEVYMKITTHKVELYNLFKPNFNFGSIRI